MDCELSKTPPKRGCFIIRMVLNRRSPLVAHCLLVGFVVLMVAADHSHRIYRQASALRRPSVE